MDLPNMAEYFRFFQYIHSGRDGDVLPALFSGKNPEKENVDSSFYFLFAVGAVITNEFIPERHDYWFYVCLSY